MLTHKRHPTKPNQLVIYKSQYCILYLDLNDNKIKVEGGNMDKSAQDLMSKLSDTIMELVKTTLKDPNKVVAIFENMHKDDLTNMLLQYKLMIEKKLFERT
jgi:hypothetical protein